MKYLFEHGEVLVGNVSEVLKVVDEGSSRLRVFQCDVTRDVGVAIAPLTGAKFLVVDSRPVNLHGVAFQVEMLIFDNVLTDDCT
jgi:hypothetical protein